MSPALPLKADPRPPCRRSGPYLSGLLSAVEIGPDIRPAFAADAANKARQQCRTAERHRASSRRRSRCSGYTAIVAAINQQTTHARFTWLSEGDLSLAGRFGHGVIQAGAGPSGNRAGMRATAFTKISNRWSPQPLPFSLIFLVPKAKSSASCCDRLTLALRRRRCRKTAASYYTDRV
jgi:hypothetical protein